MEKADKKRAVALGLRIVFCFLATLGILILAAGYSISHNVHVVLRDYTLKLVEAMVEQGVATVEYEIGASLEETEVLAGSFHVPESAGDRPEFPAQQFDEMNELRMVYVTEKGSISSDGRERHILEREDVQAAFGGETSIYGPYFNEEGEYVICYSAPVWDQGVIAGVLSIEKDGYDFGRLIESIRFGDSGEAYIINTEGTDIAVSRAEHIDWVNSEYNAQKLLEKGEDFVTRSVLELEQKGLSGESGFDTYYWDGSLCYLFYKPIPSTGWVLLAGVREEEISAMAHTALTAGASSGAAVGLCIIVFLLLTALVVFWILTDMKKSAEINEKLELIANHDALTGLLNRRFLENSLAQMWKYPVKVPDQAVVLMMDIDNFKKYNDYFGHPKGDACLRRMAAVLKREMDILGGDAIRYGGEEFVGVAFAVDSRGSLELGNRICRMIEEEKVPDGRGGVMTVSVGVCYVDTTLKASLYECIEVADKALYQAKSNGKNQAVLLEKEEPGKN